MTVEEVTRVDCNRAVMALAEAGYLVDKHQLPPETEPATDIVLKAIKAGRP
jgi:hypothetical protein